MVADVAGLRRVGRIDGNNLNPFFEPFVFKKSAKLIERPRIRASALRLVARLLIGSIANACQIFNCNSSTLRFGSFDDALADGVVQPSLIPLLPSRQPFQDISHPAARGSCAFRDFYLKRRSDLGKIVSSSLNRFPVPFVAARRYSNISASKVNADHLVRLNWIRRLVFELNMQIVLPVTMFAQLSRGRITSLKFASLIDAGINLDVFPAVNQRQTCCPIFLTKREDSSIIICRCGTERNDRLVFLFRGFPIRSDARADSERQSGAQLKLFSQVLIDLTLNRGLTGHASFNSLICIVTAIRKRFEQGINFGYLFSAGLKLANNGQYLFHESKNLTSDCKLAYTRNRGDPGRIRRINPRFVFPPCAEATGLPNLGGLREVFV
jgi:hypothetical protein